MTCIKSGKDDPIPEVKAHHFLFVDMWGNWELYEDYYGTFQDRLETFVNSRKSQCDYFNPNYIRKYESK